MANRVLLVEDSEDNRGLVRQIAEWMELTLLEAGNGIEGIERAIEERPDLILMDLSLPVLSGWEATRRLKSDPRTSAIPVIALTAHAMAGDESRALEVGCDAYLSKPIDLMSFRRTLEAFLGGRHATHPDR